MRIIILALFFITISTLNGFSKEKENYEFFDGQAIITKSSFILSCRSLTCKKIFKVQQDCFVDYKDPVAFVDDKLEHEFESWIEVTGYQCKQPESEYISIDGYLQKKHVGILEFDYFDLLKNKNTVIYSCKNENCEKLFDFSMISKSANGECSAKFIDTVNGVRPEGYWRQVISLECLLKKGFPILQNGFLKIN